MEKWRKRSIVVFGLIEALLFSGCLFGWTSLLHVLQQEGVYSHLCHIEEIDSTVISALNVLPSSNNNNNATTTTTMVTLIPYTKAITNNVSAAEGEMESLLQDNPFIQLLGTELQEEEEEYKDEEGMNNKSESTRLMKSHRCSLQDNQFSLIYTIAAVNYGLMSIVIGYSLDKFGLWIIRIIACLMTTFGFVCLTFTSKEIPWLLWPAMNLISIGSAQLRQSSFQFANIYPKQRATILTLYSAAYSISTTLFLLVQYGHRAGIPYMSTISAFTAISMLSFPATIIMPRIKIEDQPQERNKNNFHHKVLPEKYAAPLSRAPPFRVPLPHLSSVGNSEEELEEKVVIIGKKDSKGNEETKDKESTQLKIQINTEEEGEKRMTNNNPYKMDDDEDQQIAPRREEAKIIPLKESLFTLSAFLHMHWQFINSFLVLFYTVSFNPWAYKVTDDPNQIAFYNEIGGLCQLIAPVFTPIAGIVTDALIRRAEKNEDRVEKLATTLEAPAYMLAISTIVIAAMLTCKMFLTKEAIYISLGLIAISRPLLIGCLTTYIRIRFHSSHFNRLFGIFTTFVSITCFIQYPLFLWMFSSPHNFNKVNWLLMGLLLTSFASPAHMLFRCLSRKYALAMLKYSS